MVTLWGAKNVRGMGIDRHGGGTMIHVMIQRGLKAVSQQKMRSDQQTWELQPEMMVWIGGNHFNWACLQYGLELNRKY